MAVYLHLSWVPIGRCGESVDGVTTRRRVLGMSEGTISYIYRGCG